MHICAHLLLNAGCRGPQWPWPCSLGPESLAARQTAWTPVCAVSLGLMRTAASITVLEECTVVGVFFFVFFVDAACIIANCAEELLDVLPLRIDVFLGKPGNRKSSLVAINNLFPMLGNAVAHVVSVHCTIRVCTFQRYWHRPPPDGGSDAGRGV